jgi:hypothetical protein
MSDYTVEAPLEGAELDAYIDEYGEPDGGFTGFDGEEFGRQVRQGIEQGLAPLQEQFRQLAGGQPQPQGVVEQINQQLDDHRTLLAGELEARDFIESTFAGVDPDAALEVAREIAPTVFAAYQLDSGTFAEQGMHSLDDVAKRVMVQSAHMVRQEAAEQARVDLGNENIAAQLELIGRTLGRGREVPLSVAWHHAEGFANAREAETGKPLSYMDAVPCVRDGSRWRPASCRSSSSRSRRRAAAN